MPARDHHSLVREVYEAYDSREFDTAAGLHAPDLELRIAATGEVFRGREGYLQYARGWAAAFPDSRFRIDQIHSGEERVTAQLTMRGTHTGTLIGSHGHIPPTWAQVELPLCEVLAIRNGQIAEVDSYFDTGTLLRQMGLLPNSPLHAPDRRATLEMYALEPETSAQQRNKAVVKQFVGSVLGRHDPAAAEQFSVPNFAWHGGPMGEIRDLGSYMTHLQTLFEAFPDLQVEIEDEIAEADRVSIRTVLTGTHRGDFLGVPPTGRRIRATGASTFRIVDRRIVEEWWQHDLYGILAQLKAVPTLASTSSAGR